VFCGLCGWINTGEVGQDGYFVLDRHAIVTFVLSGVMDNDQLAPFYEQIVEHTGSHKVLPRNSGAEAVESAIKSVRKWGYEVKGVPGGQAEIFVCADNFHGRTLGITSFSTDAAAREHFGPFALGFRIIPFSNANALEEAITLSFGNDWQAIEIARGRFTPFFQMGLEIVV
jgi:acetylornithine/succinyldiaminopimelate/putrescine aminotransferase